MNCKKAGNLMMRYMECVLTKDEALKLNIHILDCPDCREEFSVYTDIIPELEPTESVVVPESLTPDIMMRIFSDECYIYKKDRTEDFMCFMWGATSLFAGLLTLFMCNPKLAFQYLGNAAAYDSYVSIMNNLSVNLELIKISLVEFFNSLSITLINSAESLEYLNLSIMMVLVVAQLFVYRKVRVEA